ncbi:hypothetical protein OGATHE_003430 [Ogataea polymorpha]|uniref:Uncharacterized protein n=1 Tax=Ogataea polymorpha TaxID=460523 RepID=A0A9P8P3Y8_9ASCO|nr:hypothetical protein OGATHE_003430 [Ogataea polymorpha]
MSASSDLDAISLGTGDFGGTGACDGDFEATFGCGEWIAFLAGASSFDEPRGAGGSELDWFCEARLTAPRPLSSELATMLLHVGADEFVCLVLLWSIFERWVMVLSELESLMALEPPKSAEVSPNWPLPAGSMNSLVRLWNPEGSTSGEKTRSKGAVDCDWCCLVCAPSCEARWNCPFSGVSDRSECIGPALRGRITGSLPITCESELPVRICEGSWCTGFGWASGSPVWSSLRIESSVADSEFSASSGDTGRIGAWYRLLLESGGEKRMPCSFCVRVAVSLTLLFTYCHTSSLISARNTSIHVFCSSGFKCLTQLVNVFRSWVNPCRTSSVWGSKAGTSFSLP